MGIEPWWVVPYKRIRTVITSYSAGEPNPMSNNRQEKLAHEEIYSAASEWLRTTNTIIWSMGSIFVSLSFTSLGLAVANPGGKYYLAGGSILLFLFWIYNSLLYRRTTIIAREVLMSIEKEWGVKEEIAFYRLQGQLSSRWYTFPGLQISSLILLVALWIALIIFFK